MRLKRRREKPLSVHPLADQLANRLAEIRDEENRQREAMRVFTMVDYAYDPAVLPPCDIIAGYLESPGAAHPWTPEMWARAKAHCPGRVPIFVAVPGGDAVAGAHYGAEAVNQSRNLGVPEGAVIVLDVEHGTAREVVESGQVHAWVGAVATAGFTPVIYGSVTDKALLAPIGKLWGAHWGQPAKIPAGYVALQYEGGPGHPIDVSVVSTDLHIAGITPGSKPVDQSGGKNGVFVGMAKTHTGKGYWLINDQGAVFSFGDAKYHGGANSPDVSEFAIVGICPTPDDGGYWILASNGGVFSYGNAEFYGSEGGK